MRIVAEVERPISLVEKWEVVVSDNLRCDGAIGRRGWERPKDNTGRLPLRHPGYGGEQQTPGKPT
jgi:hypothetical protein